MMLLITISDPSVGDVVMHSQPLSNGSISMRVSIADDAVAPTLVWASGLDSQSFYWVTVIAVLFHIKGLYRLRV